MGPFQIAIAPWRVVSYLCTCTSFYVIFLSEKYPPSLPSIIVVLSHVLSTAGCFQICGCPFREPGVSEMACMKKAVYIVYIWVCLKMGYTVYPHL